MLGLNSSQLINVINDSCRFIFIAMDPILSARVHNQKNDLLQALSSNLIWFMLNILYHKVCNLLNKDGNTIRKWVRMTYFTVKCQPSQLTANFNIVALGHSHLKEKKSHMSHIKCYVIMLNRLQSRMLLQLESDLVFPSIFNNKKPYWTPGMTHIDKLAV